MTAEGGGGGLGRGVERLSEKGLMNMDNNVVIAGGLNGNRKNNTNMNKQTNKYFHLCFHLLQTHTHHLDDILLLFPNAIKTHFSELCLNLPLS